MNTGRTCKLHTQRPCPADIKPKSNPAATCPDQREQSRIEGWIALPNGLIGKPSSITLVVSIIVGSLELRWSSNGCTILDTSSLGLLKRQGVAGGDGSVVEHDACEIQRVSRRHRNKLIWLTFSLREFAGAKLLVLEYHMESIK